MSQLRTVRGIHDILPDAHEKFSVLIDTASLWAKRFGFRSINLPLLEYEEVFKRTLGETSDVVSKEMFTLEAREKEERIVLRPEATASCIRAFLQHGLHHQLPQKFFYWGPMFRYERPQKGRLRQFHQFGVEFIGVDNPFQDADVIALGHTILKNLDLINFIELEINTLGDTFSRQNYRHALVDYFSQHKKDLSEDSLKRLITNPLRILDSKDPGDNELKKKAPLFEEFLSQESKEHFSRVCEGLTMLNIPFKRNPYLVRGLDYYCHTTFEFVTKNLGAQGTVIAGGRYDGLTKYMGAESIPSLGWAAGIERLMLLLDEKNTVLSSSSPRLGLLPIDKEKASIELCWKLGTILREAGFFVNILFEGNAGKRLKKLDKMNVDAAILIGEDERNNNQATIKFLRESRQDKVDFSMLSTFLKENFSHES